MLSVTTGVGTTFQRVPFQCSIRFVEPSLPVRFPPAHTSSEETAAMALK
jgi:hypothetical protein